MAHRPQASALSSFHLARRFVGLRSCSASPIESHDRQQEFSDRDGAVFHRPDGMDVFYRPAADEGRNGAPGAPRTSGKSEGGTRASPARAVRQRRRRRASFARGGIKDGRRARGDRHPHTGRLFAAEGRPLRRFETEKLQGDEQPTTVPRSICCLRPVRIILITPCSDGSQHRGPAFPCPTSKPPSGNLCAETC
jgi:hypothetical protein